MSRKAFIAIHLLLLLVPFATGALELAVGSKLLAPLLDMTLGPSRMMDSNLRFFGGLWFMCGVMAVWALRDLNRRALFVQWLWALIFAGGIGRAISMVVVGLPPAPFIGFTALELIGAPLFVLWLRRLTPRAL